jgi:FAD/FMN-containing dehydrogenase
MTLSFAPDRIEMWPMAKLQPYARNAKAHGAEQVAKIAASMAEFGWTVPCLVGEDGELIAGHGRVLAATQLGLTEAPVIVLGHLTEAQRLAMWKRRELAAEITIARQPAIDTDIALPLDLVPEFYRRIHALLPALDPGCDTLSVCHLGDGNVHFTVFPTREGLYDTVVEAVEDVVQDLRGSFSAEHGVGLSKLNTMARRKDPVALDVMRKIKSALDPDNLMNPGKVIPPP